MLKAAARQRLLAGQGEFDLSLDQVGSPTRPGAALPITSTRMRHLTDALTCAFTSLGLDVASGGNEVFAALVLARIIEPTSKPDSLRVLEEAGCRLPA